MKRDIMRLKPSASNHDDYQVEKFNSRRSQRARARDKRKEHRHARTLAKREIEELLN